MILSKLYTNRPGILEPIEFRDGLNIILGQIRAPSDRTRSSHNLGKSTIGRLIDFCLLSSNRTVSFLFEHPDLFDEFVFLLEIKLKDDSYLTIRRSVDSASKINYKLHTLPNQDYSLLEAKSSEWNHINLDFERAKSLLDSYINWSSLKPSNFRNVLGYQLRSQLDYSNEFKLKNHAGGDYSWKPTLFRMFGLDSNLIEQSYEYEDEINNQKKDISRIKKESGLSTDDIDTDISRIEGVILINNAEIDKLQEALDTFDFRENDHEQTLAIVNEIDVEISVLNNKRYSLNKAIKTIEGSIEKSVMLFRPDKARKLFAESNVLFDGQIKKNFEQLITFNESITSERKKYLEVELASRKEEVVPVSTRLNVLGEKRAKSLSFLKETDIFDKYKDISNSLIAIKSDIQTFENQRKALYQLKELEKNLSGIKDDRKTAVGDLKSNITEQAANNKSTFSKIRVYFNEIIKTVLNKNAIVDVKLNSEGHAVFSADFLNNRNKKTSEREGNSYKRLLCIAFDMAMLRAHENENFPKLLYHDGAFETLDDRQKWNLMEVFRKYSEYGIQHIITLIDSEIPTLAKEGEIFINDKNELTLLLHDLGHNGRLFKIPTF